MKSRYIAAILAFFLGGMGAHKFYLGKTGQGILYLIFFWTGIPAIVGLIEAILFLTGNGSEFNAKYGKPDACSSDVSGYEFYQVGQQSQTTSATKNSVTGKPLTTVGSVSNFSQTRKIVASTKASNPQNN